MLRIVLVLLLVAPAVAQAQDPLPAVVERAPQSGFVEAASEVCLAALEGATAVADHSGAQSHLRAASSETRAAHPFGREDNLWELASEQAGAVTVRGPDARTCSVFAVGVPPAQSFEALAQVLLGDGYTELEVRRQQEGRVQRTFRSADGAIRVELEGFIGGMPAFAGGDLAMAHIGRRR